MALKILLISYYWPPAGGPGVQRWLKFVKYFREFDIEPIVYIPKNPTYPLTDDSLEKEIPKNVTILTKPIFEPYRFAEIFSKKDSKTISKGIITDAKKQSWLQKILLYIRGNFFIPDARKFWVQPSVRFLEEYLKENEIDTIITTGPPHSMHLIGLQLKKRIGVKWVADFRDPWTTIGYQNKLKLTSASKLKHQKLEKEVLHSADHVVATSFTTKEEFAKITPQPITLITNGYDDEVIETVSLDSKFSVAHIGSLLSERNPLILWKVLSELIKEYPDFSEAFILHLVGTVSADVTASIIKFGLSDYVKHHGYVSHQEAVRLQRTTQVLLLIEIDREETKSIIPGKLFEYIHAKRPILALGPENADLFQIIEETNSGHFFTYQQHSQLKNQILSYFELYKKGDLNIETRNIEQYSRRALTQKMATLLHQIAD